MDQRFCYESVSKRADRGQERLRREPSGRVGAGFLNRGAAFLRLVSAKPWCRETCACWRSLASEAVGVPDDHRRAGPLHHLPALSIHAHTGRGLAAPDGARCVSRGSHLARIRLDAPPLAGGLTFVPNVRFPLPLRTLAGGVRY